MFELKLNEDEAEVLLSTLETELSDLSYEISNTDEKDFREQIKTRRQILETIRDNLQRETITRREDFIVTRMIMT